MNSKILIADDESSVRKMITSALTDRHFTVSAAPDGDHALKMANKDDYALILLDVRMPGMDGMEVLRRLRQNQATRLVPVILVTGMGETDEKIEGLALGADDYVVKPFSMNELMARVDRLIKRAAEELSANPLTHLPGSPRLEEVVRGRIDAKRPFALLYLDIDRFKSFNDAYGFAKGDRLLKTCGEIVSESVRDIAGDEGLAAHIGGDDFAAVCDPDKAAELAHKIACRFDAAAACLYRPEDRKRGCVQTLDRAGNLTRQPIVTVRIGVASTATRPLTHYAQAAEIASEMKCWLKQKGGRLSRFAIDRRHAPAKAIATAAALLLAMVLAPGARATKGLESLGSELAVAAKKADAKRVAVPPFEVPAGLSPWAGADAAEAVLRGFTRKEASRAVEREHLDMLLSERRLAWAGAVGGADADAPRLAAADAIVVGRLSRAPTGWKADARLVSVDGGLVLGAASVDLEEMPQEAPAAVAAREDESFPPLAALRERAGSFAGVATVEVLEDWLRRRDLPAARRAPAALALANAAPGSELALGEALHDPEPLVRLCAALGLGKARAAWAEGALRRMLNEDASWVARYGAATALGRLGGPSATQALTAALSNDGSWQVRQQAASLLASRTDSRAAAAALARALQDKEGTVRAAAGAAMAEWRMRADG